MYASISLDTSACAFIRGICAYTIRIEISCTCTYVSHNAMLFYFFFFWGGGGRGAVLLEDFRAIARSFGKSRKLMIV